MIIHKTIVVKNHLGLHLQAAAEMVYKLSRFKSDIAL